MPIGTKNPVIPGCGLHHVAVEARDWDATLRFYKDALGMPIVADFSSPQRNVVLVEMGDGGCIEILGPTEDTPKAGTAPANYPVTHLALTTTDTGACLERVRQAGYEVIRGPMDVNLGSMTATLGFVKGPNGEVIEFFQTH